MAAGFVLDFKLNKVGQLTFKLGEFKKRCGSW
jgi:hypothetical protein